MAFSIEFSVCLFVGSPYVTNFLILLQHNIRPPSHNCDPCATELAVGVNLSRCADICPCDKCPPDSCPRRQLPPATTAPRDNCPQGQNGYIGFPYHPLVRPKRHRTACAIGPKGEARTHGPRAPSVPKAKLGYTDRVRHRSQRRS